MGEIFREALLCCWRCCLRLPPAVLSGNGASLGGNGDDMFLRAASRRDSLRFRAMLTICAESMSSGAAVGRSEPSSVVASVRESRWAATTPLMVSEVRALRLEADSGVREWLPFEVPLDCIFSGVAARDVVTWCSAAARCRRWECVRSGTEESARRASGRRKAPLDLCL